MKILFTILLSLLVFFQSVGINISDIFMVIDLVEHAKFHAEEHGDDFFTFFEKHYGTLKAEHQKEHQEERSQHENLPFQHSNITPPLSEVDLADTGISLKRTLFSSTATHQFYYKDLYSFLERESIFQPPKFA